jgi:uncharacterized membrane protein YtjA (UPF0391 family)
VTSLHATARLEFPKKLKQLPSGMVRASAQERRFIMLHYALVFFVIAIIAAVFGFGGIAAGAAGIAKLLFVGFLIVAIATLLLGRRSAL